MAGSKLTKAEKDVIDDLIQAIIIEDLGKNVFKKQGDKFGKSYVAHMKTEMPRTMMKLDYMKKRIPEIRQEWLKEWQKDNE